ncbi:MAG: DUF4139 domain-containing protein [Alphaproteobacteria bacterium]|nr:DUF4139 domain-containing protein [Alphaproteobacteria bacterium]
MMTCSRILLILGLTGLPALASAAELELRRVLLSSGGVGYFEYEAEVEGNANLSLSVRRDQVDDLLKSMVVFDERGAVGQVSLAGAEALRDIFRDLPFDGTALDDPAGLLNALRGHEVNVAGSSQVRGRIVSAAMEPVRLPGDGGTVSRLKLTLLAPDGLKNVTVQDLDAVAFADAALQARLSAALAALAGAQDRERRVLAIRAEGEGRRKLRVAWVSEAPLWKASYRLTVSGEPGAKNGDLQGWASLENRTGTDWKDVELTLVSGSPVTFRQALYATYYVDRPEVPVEVIGRVLPRPDQGGIAAQTMADAPVPSREKRAESGAAPLQASRGFAPAAAPAVPEPPPLAALVTGETGEQQTQVRFRLPRPVTLPSGQNVLVPIVARSVPAERVALYQPQTHALHPLAAIHLANDGTSALPPGIVTLYERGADGISHIGDARLAPLPAGEKRLLAFALDGKVRIDQEQKRDAEIARLRAARGILEVTRTEQATTIYRVVAPAGDARRLVLEQPRRPDFTIVKPDKGVEIAEGNWRIAVALGAGQGRIEVIAERPVLERVQLLQASDEQIRLLLQAPRLSERQREGLQRVAALAGERAKVAGELARLERDRGALVGEQARLRANLQAVPQGSDLHRRYLTQLGGQEDRLAQLDIDIKVKQAELQGATTRLEDFARTLEF